MAGLVSGMRELGRLLLHTCSYRNTHLKGASCLLNVIRRSSLCQSADLSLTIEVGGVCGI